MFGAIARRRVTRGIMGQRRRETRSTSQIKDRLSLLIFRGHERWLEKGAKAIRESGKSRPNLPSRQTAGRSEANSTWLKHSGSAELDIGS